MWGATKEVAEKGEMCEFHKQDILNVVQTGFHRLIDWILDVNEKIQ